MGSYKALATASVVDIALVSITAMAGIAALAAGVQGWLFKQTTRLERWLLILAGLALVYPKAMFDVIGIGLFAGAIVLQKLRKFDARPAAG